MGTGDCVVKGLSGCLGEAVRERSNRVRSTCQVRRRQQASSLQARTVQEPSFFQRSQTNFIVLSCLILRTAPSGRSYPASLTAARSSKSARDRRAGVAYGKRQERLFCAPVPPAPCAPLHASHASHRYHPPCTPSAQFVVAQFDGRLLILKFHMSLPSVSQLTCQLLSFASEFRDKKATRSTIDALRCATTGP